MKKWFEDFKKHYDNDDLREPGSNNKGYIFEGIGSREIDHNVADKSEIGNKYKDGNRSYQVLDKVYFENDNIVLHCKEI